MHLGKGANTLASGLLVLDSLGSGVCQVTSLSLDVMFSFLRCYTHDTQHSAAPRCMNKKYYCLPNPGDIQDIMDTNYFVNCEAQYKYWQVQ